MVGVGQPRWGAGQAPTVITHAGDPCPKAHHYGAPFALADREDDYRVAWTFFERQDVV